MGPEVSTGHYYNKVVGWLKIVTTDVGVSEISFVKSPGQRVESVSNPFLKSLFTELDNYFRGTSRTLLLPYILPKELNFSKECGKNC